MLGKTEPQNLFGSLLVDFIDMGHELILIGVLGFYPVTPGTGIYAIGAPRFPELSLKLSKNGSSKSFKIIANNLSEENKYIQSVTLDGIALKTPLNLYPDNGQEWTYI